MNASTARALGIVLIVLVVFFAVGAIRSLFFVPDGILHGIFHDNDGHRIFRFGYWTWPWVGFVGLFGIAVLVFWIVAMVWVYRDAESRGMAGAIWALVVFFGHFAGFIVYLLVRSGRPVVAPRAPSAPAPGAPAGSPPIPPFAAPSAPPKPAACSKCGKPVSKDHAFCPFCGEKLRPACPKCGASAEPAWKACPSCGEKL
ncbi:MAG: zinc-ribbon domain-containing protein [Candidatus Aminicenantes bacterium]|nr:zinc-ribbon domain-containing protein [Candidatus Aminicenantes bacterium]